MTSVKKSVVCCSILLVLVCVPALASELIDGEVGAVWWSNEFESKSGGLTDSSDSGAPGFRAELWLKRTYGLRATQFGSDVDELDADGADYTSVDVMWRAFSPTDNNFIAVGLGWQQMDFDGVGVGGDTSGLRVSVEGRVGFMDQLYGYGQGTLMPSLDDVSTLGTDYEDLDGYEWEVGVSWHVAPFLSMRAGYRADSVDFNLGETVLAGGGGSTPEPVSGGSGMTIVPAEALTSRPSGLAVATDDGSTRSEGYFVGLGFRF